VALNVGSARPTFQNIQLSDKWLKRVALRRPSGEYGIDHHAITIIRIIHSRAFGLWAGVIAIVGVADA
jgi:hypothetical protein